MDIGLMWFDNRKDATYHEKILCAVKYYYKKYGIVADTCWLAIDAPEIEVPGMEIIYSKVIMPNYFWIGSKK